MGQVMAHEALSIRKGRAESNSKVEGRRSDSGGHVLSCGHTSANAGSGKAGSKRSRLRRAELEWMLRQLSADRWACGQSPLSMVRLLWPLERVRSLTKRGGFCRCHHWRGWSKHKLNVRRGFAYGTCKVLVVILKKGVVRTNQRGIVPHQRQRIVYSAKHIIQHKRTLQRQVR